jgi:fatty acid CoA ligase FadD9
MKTSFNVNSYGVVLFNFESTKNHHLSVKKDEIVFILEERNEGASYCKNENGEFGILPTDCLEYVILDESKKIFKIHPSFETFRNEIYNCDVCDCYLMFTDIRFHCLNCPLHLSNICHSCFEKNKELKHNHELKFHHEGFFCKMRRNQELFFWLNHNVSTSYCLDRSFDYFEDRPCIGERQNNGTYHWYTYKEIGEISRNIGCGLKKLLDSFESKFVGICSLNRYEWFATEWGCLFQALPTISLSRNAVNSLNILEISSILEYEISILVLSEEVLLNLLKMKSQIKIPKCIILMDSLKQKPSYVDEINEMNIKLYDFEAILTLGKDNPSPIIHSNLDDIISIIFTSGSTGIPKGAVFIDKIWFNSILDFSNSMPLVSVCHSPLNHFPERGSAMSMIASGGRIGIFSGELNDLIRDIQDIEPTFLSASPIFFTTIYKEYEKLLSQQKLKNKEFNENKFIEEYSKIFGCRIVNITTGGAPTSETVLKFLRDCFKCNIYNSYGSTECGLIFEEVNGEQWIPPDVTLKLIDAPELNYFTSDFPNPRGELLFKGPDTIPNYFQNEEKTNELIDNLGFYHTGDIVEIRNGKYFIIDRKKNIFKLSHGEFVSPEIAENICIASPFIHQIFISGNSIKSHVVAVIVPNQQFLENFAKENGIMFNSMKELVENNFIYDNIMKDLMRLMLISNRPLYEIPKGIYLELEAFTQENDLLTSSLKIGRSKLNIHYKDILESIYEKIEKLDSKEQFFKIIQQVLELDSIESLKNKNFIEIGGDSLSAMKISSFMKTNKLTADLLLDKNVSLQDLSNSLESEKYTLEDDLKLDLNIKLSNFGVEKVHIFKDILLTGATGFLGPFVIESLIKKFGKDISIFCLVRGKDEKEAMLKLNSNLTKMGIKTNQITLIFGDFSKPYFGLLLNEYKDLALRIDSIFHCGALVNSILPYSSHRKSNVLGTVEIIKFSCYCEKLKPIFFTSTISVYGDSTIVHENDPLNSNQFESSSGYGQSKWVAEKLLEKAKELGIPILIFRCGYIGPHSTTGSSNLNDWVMRFIGGIIQCKITPSDKEIMSFSPVDSVSDLIVEISSKFQNLKYFIFNVVDVDSVKMPVFQLNSILKKMEIPLDEIEKSIWFDEISVSIERSNPLYPILKMFRDGFPSMNEEIYENSNLFPFLKEKTPITPEDYIKNIILFMKNEKFINLKRKRPEILQNPQ